MPERPRPEEIHDLEETILAHFVNEDYEPVPEDVVVDVQTCVRTVVDEECGTLQEHRELGLRIMRRLGVSPLGRKL